MTAIQPGAPVGIHIQSIHFVSNNTYPCLLYKVMKTCDVLNFCKSILCYFIQSDSSAKRYFWDNPCQVNQQLFPFPIYSDHLKEKKNYFTEFYMNLIEKISVIKKKTDMSAKVLIKKWKIKLLKHIQREFEKRNCR